MRVKRLGSEIYCDQRNRVQSEGRGCQQNSHHIAGRHRKRYYGTSRPTASYCARIRICSSNTARTCALFVRNRVVRCCVELPMKGSGEPVKMMVKTGDASIARDVVFQHAPRLVERNLMHRQFMDLRRVHGTETKRKLQPR